MLEHILQFKLTCSTCHEELEAEIDQSSIIRPIVIRVSPCKTCLENEADERFEEGYSAGKKDAEEDKDES